MRILHSLLRALRWHRRTFAAIAVAVAVLAALNAVTSAGSDTTAVVVASRTLAAGRPIDEASLALARLPAAAVPEGAFTEFAQVVGRTVVVDVPARAALLPSVLLDDAARAGPGKVALPVRLGEAAAVALLRVGSHVDVLGASADGSGYGVVASDVPVLALPATGDGGLLGGSDAPLVLVGVTSAEASAITAAASVSALGFALR